MNSAIRKRTLIKIAEENQAILRRLREKQPSYQIERFHKEYKDKLRILKNICEYPFSMYSQRSNQSVNAKK